MVIATPTNTAALEFKGLPARHGEARADYDVYVQFRQRVQGIRIGEGDVQYVAKECQVRVQYLQTRPPNEIEEEVAGGIDPARAYHGIHLDLSPPNVRHHPLFHVQVSVGCIPGESIGRRYLPTADDQHRCDSPRIPTAPLDLAGLVYVILHDHVPAAVVKGWPPELRTAVTKLPRLPLESFAAYLRAGASMECPWWYQHAGHHEAP